MISDSTIEELQRYEESQRRADMYENALSYTITSLEEILTSDQIKTWKLVESLIAGSTTKNTDLPIDSDQIRERLMEL